MLATVAPEMDHPLRLKTRNLRTFRHSLCIRHVHGQLDGSVAGDASLGDQPRGDSDDAAFG